SKYRTLQMLHAEKAANGAPERGDKGVPSECLLIVGAYGQRRSRRGRASGSLAANAWSMPTRAIWPGATPAPRAATSPHRRKARLRIFVVRCDLPCDPPAGGHSRNGGMIPRFHRAVWD